MMLPIAASLYDIVWNYYPLMVAYCVWGIYLYEIFSKEKWGQSLYSELN
jgi:hypothetical protein